ncbi:MAG: hypothetical protein U0587_08635 [Candidatus Binatia bacterium]
MTSTPDLTALAAQLQRLAETTAQDALPRLVGALEAAKATAWARLTVPLPRPIEPERLVDATELAPLIDRPAWSVREMARRGVIPTIRVGRLRKFRPSAVLAALERGDGTMIANPVRAEKRNTGKGRCPSGVQPISGYREESDG